MNASEKLKALREQKGMSQADCAKAMNIDRTTYAKYENGGSIRRNVEKLASFFNVSVDYLLGRTDEPGGTAGSAGVAKEEPPTPETDDISSIFDDRDIRALARKNLDGKSPEEIAKKKERLKKMLEFMFDD